MNRGIRIVDSNGEQGEDELKITNGDQTFFVAHLNRKYGLRWLHGKKGKESVAMLEKAIEEIGPERDDWKWKATKGVARMMLCILLGWARKYPDGVFEVS